LTGFEIEVCLMIDGSGWMLGLPTDRIDRTKRVLRPLALRTALRPTVAAALIQLSGANQGTGRLVDPLCGAATIPIEARRWNPLLTVEAFDWDEATINVARKTLEANKVDSVEVQLLDARELGQRFPRRYDYIVTDPPYGIRQARKVSVAKLYRGLLDSFAAALKPTGCVAMIVVKRERLHQVAEATGWQLEREVEVQLGTMQASLMLLKRRASC
jgi:putative N6-adenine-specific DNA methylase/tRNA (guanine6-N2)-methyltransferase